MEHGRPAKCRVEPVNPPQRSSGDESHYHFRISFRIRHPDADPDRITNALGIIPRRAWKAGEPRQTPTGTPLQGSYPATYWYVEVLAGRYPELDLNAGLQNVLDRRAGFRDFLHAVRAEGGSAELFVGWFLERQSGDVLSHTTVGKAADLSIDLAFDVYPPTQPQNEYDVTDVLPPNNR